MFKKIQRICPYCRCHNLVTVLVSEFENWENGELIQKAFPELSADDRELLLTGICSKCWNEIFGDDD